VLKIFICLLTVLTLSGCASSVPTQAPTLMPTDNSTAYTIEKIVITSPNGDEYSLGGELGLFYNGAISNAVLFEADLSELPEYKITIHYFNAGDRSFSIYPDAAARTVMLLKDGKTYELIRDDAYKILSHDIFSPLYIDAIIASSRVISPEGSIDSVLSSYSLEYSTPLGMKIAENSYKTEKLPHITTTTEKQLSYNTIYKATATSLTLFDENGNIVPNDSVGTFLARLNVSYANNGYTYFYGNVSYYFNVTFLGNPTVSVLKSNYLYRDVLSVTISNTRNDYSYALYIPHLDRNAELIDINGSLYSIVDIPDNVENNVIELTLYAKHENSAVYSELTTVKYQIK